MHNCAFEHVYVTKWNGDWQGCSSQRMSVVGMTPKTLRLPKKGEMLLSVRGSPLGVYNEQEDNINMEAIRGNPLVHLFLSRSLSILF